MTQSTYCPDGARRSPMPPRIAMEHAAGEPPLHGRGRVSGIKQRSLLPAELSVLTRISKAVLTKRDVDAALEEAVQGCFDAGSVEGDALYVLTPDGEIRARPLGSHGVLDQESLATFFGYSDLILQCVESRLPLDIPSNEVDDLIARDLLRRSGARSILVVPLVYLDKPLGALAVFAKEQVNDPEEWREFVFAVANQTTQVLALSEALGESQRAELVARERSAFLDAVLENIPDPVLYVDPQGVVLWASGGHPVGSFGESLLAGESHQRTGLQKRRLDHVLSTGRSVSWEEHSPTAEGEERWFWCKMSPVQRDGVVSGAVIVARDITEKKQADAKLIMSDRMASVGILAAGVAHEINNPLSAVMGNLELLLTGGVDPAKNQRDPIEFRAMLEETLDAADRIRSIVGDLKLFSRDQPSESHPVDVREVIESVLRMSGRELRKRAVVVEQYGDVPLVGANGPRLGQIVLNLLLNAAQAIPPGKHKNNTITVTTSVDDDDRVVLRVRDTGSGMSRTVQERIFTPFFTTKPVGIGTGLGLSISRRLVESFGGEMGYTTRPGSGSEFWVSLPAIDSAAVATAARTVPAPAPTGAKVLVIDDDNMVRTVLARMLETQYDVSATASASDALMTIRDGARFDVIFCDLMMPKLNGMQFFRHLSDTHPELAERVVFLSGGAHTEEGRAFLDEPLRKVINKPFTADELFRTIEGCLS